MSNFHKFTKKELLHFIEGNEYEGPVSYEANEVGVREGLIDFLKDQHIQVEGAFSANEKLYVVYSKIATPDEIEAVKGKGIFDKLKVYGSSGKYKGVVNGEGISVFPNIYHSVLPFMNDIIKIEGKGNKFGLKKLSGEVILATKYDRIDSLSELVFAVTLEGKLGFMNLKGETVIPFDYDAFDEEVAFYNGLACVKKSRDDGSYRFGYIDHRNEAVIPFQFSGAQTFKGKDYIENWITYPAGGDKSYTKDTYKLALDGTVLMVDSEHFEDTSWYKEWEANHPYDESSRYNEDDGLDAFEGDPSNRWNID